MEKHHNAFISYNHKVDAKLAAAVHRGLEKLARPVLQLRSLDIFRDKTSLAADPKLWPAIRSHLNGSEWFLLMASPGSADSEYCNKEILWWLENRSLDRMLILLTDGEIVWDHEKNRVDRVHTNALSGAVIEKMKEEPLYADFRSFRDIDHLSLKNIQFRDTILDIAAPIHDVPKNQLDGEDVRQFKRNRRFVRILQAGIAVAAVAAMVFAAIALIQRNRAILERDKAVQQARIALSQKLSSDALRTTDDKVDRALLLALTAFDIYPTAESQLSLFATLLKGRYAKFERAEGALERKIKSKQDYRLEPPDIQRMVAQRRDRNWPDPGDPDFKNGTLYVSTKDGSRIATVIEVGRDNRTIRYPATLAIWDSRTKQKTVIMTDHYVGASVFGFSPDGKLLVTGDNSGVAYLWRYRHSKGWQSERLYGHREPIRAAIFTPEGRMLITESTDGDIIYWDLMRPQSLAILLHDFKTVSLQDFGWTRVAFAKGGQNIVALGPDGKVLIWQNNGLENTAHELTAIKGAARTLAVSHDGEWVAAASNLEVCVMHLESDRHYSAPISCRAVGGLSFSADDQMIAMGGSRCLKLWRFKEEEEPQPMELPTPGINGRVYSTRFSPDGNAFFTGGTFGVIKWALRERSIIDNPEVLYRGDLMHREGFVTKIELSPDGKLLAAGTWDGGVVILSLTDTKGPPMSLTGHRGGAITGVAFSPDSRILVSCDASGKAMLWDLKMGEPLIREMNSGGITATGLAFSPDGSAFAIGSDDRLVTLWPFGIEAWRKRACTIANRDLTLQEWRFFLPDQPYRPVCQGLLDDN